MKYLHIFIFSIFLISCGSGSNIDVPNTPLTPTGNISSQVDPVQST